MGSAKEFEWVRERLKREKKEPSRYTPNRHEFLLNEARKTDGDRAVKELRKEFKLGS
jgi:hypothetical protein